MLTSDAQDRQAWYRNSLAPSDWLVPLPEAAVAELEEVVHRLKRDPLPTLLLSPTHFSLTHCHGTMVYDVRDTGKALEYGVRRSVTNLDLQFHTDAPWLALPPELVGLVCLSPAQEGGVSRFVSLVTVHEELKRRHPDLVRRLYEPVPWDRQAEHAPDDGKVSRQPIFEQTARGLRCRYNQSLVENAEGLTGTRLDDEAREALQAMRGITDSPEHCVEFRIEKGQIQYLNNRLFAHSRTPFRDSDVPS